MNTSAKKKNRYIATLCMAAVLALGTAGCAGSRIPELTEEQEKIIEEYVAMTVMKYDSGHKSRLMDLSEEELFPPSPTPAVPAPTQEPTGGASDDKSSETAVVNYSLEEVLGFPEGVTAAFTGWRLCTQYPEDGGSEGFLLPASEGKLLLAAEFIFINASEHENMVDILSSDAMFGITINESHLCRALMAVLPDNMYYMSTFQETIPAGGSAEAVLLVEVDNDIAGTISTLSLNIKNNSKAYKIQLQ